MAIYQKLINYYDELSDSKIKKTFVNDIPYDTAEDKAKLRDMLVTVYDDEEITTIPSCDCGQLSGKYLLNRVCSVCNTEVKDIFDKRDPVLWFKSPNPKLKFISPMFCAILRYCLMSKIDKEIDYVRWLSDSSYNPNPELLPQWLLNLTSIRSDFTRSYSYFTTHLREYLVYFSSLPNFKSKTTINMDALLQVYDENKEAIMTTHIAVPNKRLFVIENTSKGKYTNMTVSSLRELVLTFINGVNGSNMTEKKINNLMAKTISKSTDLFYDFFQTYLGGKPGLYRKNIFGARVQFAFRNVITPLLGKHDLDEIHIPWSTAIVVFRPHILNKLRRMHNMKYKEASRLLSECMYRYDARLDKIFQTLISESKYKGIPNILQRNPSLFMGSANLTYITKVKTNPSDFSISSSILIQKLFNGDYDGDELNNMLTLDNKLTELMSTMSAHNSVPGLRGNYDVSSNLHLPKTTVSTITNWLSVDEGVINDYTKGLLDAHGVEMVIEQ